MPLDLVVIGAATGVCLSASAAAAARARQLYDSRAEFSPLRNSDTPPSAKTVASGLADKLRGLASGVGVTTRRATDSAAEPWLSRAAAKDGTPWAYECPITVAPMRDPVRAADGIVYERAAILEWFARPPPPPGIRLGVNVGTAPAAPTRSPVTGEPLANRHLRAETALRREIESWHASTASATRTYASYTSSSASSPAAAASAGPSSAASPEPPPHTPAPTARYHVTIEDFGELAGVALQLCNSDGGSGGGAAHAAAHPTGAAAMVSLVLPGSTAARAGARAGDRLVSVDGAPLPDGVTGAELVNIVAAAGRPVRLTLARAEKGPTTAAALLGDLSSGFGFGGGSGECDGAEAPPSTSGAHVVL